MGANSIAEISSLIMCLALAYSPLTNTTRLPAGCTGSSASQAANRLLKALTSRAPGKLGRHQLVQRPVAQVHEGAIGQDAVAHADHVRPCQLGRPGSAWPIAAQGTARTTTSAWAASATVPATNGSSAAT
jgi:hypothetical protein